MLKELGVALAAAVSVISVASAQTQRGQPVQLPEGHGKDLVEANCARCHGPGQIVNAGYTEKDWQAPARSSS